jgi:hypothetical protein
MKNPAAVATTLLFGAATAMTACSGGAGSAGPAPVLQMESLTTPEKATPIPTPFATGRACNKPDATKIPGIYTWIVSYGNVVGHTYTQDNDNPGGFESVYEDWLFYPTPTPSPTVTPTATAKPKPTPTPTLTATPFTPPPTPKPTATPKPLYEKVTTYVGTYSMPGYDIEVDGEKYPVQRTAGCAQIVLFQAPNGTAGQVRPRAEVMRPDYSSYGGDNTMAFANEKPPSDVEIEAVNDGAIKSLSITNLTPDTGKATITLDNGIVGTMAITGSSTATIEYATEPAARPAVDSQRAASLLEQFGPALER